MERSGQAEEVEGVEFQPSPSIPGTRFSIPITLDFNLLLLITNENEHFASFGLCQICQSPFYPEDPSQTRDGPIQDLREVLQNCG